MSKKDSDKHRVADGLKSGIVGSPDDDTKQTPYDLESVGTDLDILSGNLAKLESDMSGLPSNEVSAEGSGADITGQESSVISNEHEGPHPISRPVIIKTEWKDPAGEESLDPETEMYDDLSIEEKSALAEECKDALDRLRQYKGDKEREVIALTEQIELEKGHQQDLETRFKEEKELLKAERDGLARERESRLQSARTQAYALHAAGKYHEAVMAYQDYFDLLENKNCDIPALQASRKCARQEEWSKSRTRRKWALLVLAGIILGIEIIGTVHVANRTVESARIASDDVDLNMLKTYCDRLDSSLIHMGSFGAVTYMYGPELRRWRNQIDSGGQESTDSVSASTNINVGAVDPVGEAPHIAKEETSPVAAAYNNQSLLSYKTVPAGQSAFIYIRQSEDCGNDHLEFLLNPDRCYWLSISNENFDLYTEPIALESEAMEETLGPRIRSASKKRQDKNTRPYTLELEGIGLNEGAEVSWNELLQLMEVYEKRQLVNKWRALGGSRRELNRLSR